MSEILERRLLVGLDLCDDYTQISCYNEKTFEPECLGVDDQEEGQFIPTVMAVRNDTKEWLFGREALSCCEEGKGECVDHLLEKVVRGEPFVVFGSEVSHVKVMRKFLSKILNLLRIEYPNETIRKLVVAVDGSDKALTETIYQALEELGVQEDRATVISHKQSYLYYALCQKKEIWLNDVGMFDFSGEGLKYYQLVINRSRRPTIVGVTEKDYSESLRYDMLGSPEENQEAVSYVFENIAKSATHKQIVSTLYMIGKGFDGDWSDSTLQKLCVGRRVFKGKNLYVKGACYAAREMGGHAKLEEFIFLDEEMLPCHIYAKMYVEAQEKEVVLIKAGTPWFDAKCDVDVIPDGEDELPLMVRNVVSREEEKHLVPLEMVKERPKRMTRLNLRIHFQDRDTCVVTIKDKGFGDAYKTSNRIWERTMRLCAKAK